MHAYFYKIFVFVALIYTILPPSANAQKNNSPRDKPISKSQIPTDGKSAGLSTLELAVVEEINLARSNPQKFVGFVEEYRQAIKGNLIFRPGKATLRTVEGAAVLDEAIGEMKAVSNLSNYEISDKLSATARMQLKDLQEDSSLGHTGKDGSNLKTRLAHFVAVKGKAGENICYRSETARDVTLTFVIDDGVKSRTHRRNVLSPTFTKIGVACGTGKNNQSLCVTVFAENFKDGNVANGIVEF